MSDLLRLDASDGSDYAAGGSRPLALAEGGNPPAEYLMFGPGVNETVKGPLLFDEEAAASVMAEYEARGRKRLAGDWEHDSMVPSDQRAPGYKGSPASHWFTLEVRPGPELWAVDVKWTPTAFAQIQAAEYGHTSPVVKFDKATGRIVAVLSSALTNDPATIGQPQLVAATAQVDDMELADWKEGDHPRADDGKFGSGGGSGSSEHPDDKPVPIPRTPGTEWPSKGSEVTKPKDDGEKPKSDANPSPAAKPDSQGNPNDKPPGTAAKPDARMKSAYERGKSLPAEGAAADERRAIVEGVVTAFRSANGDNKKAVAEIGKYFSPNELAGALGWAEKHSDPKHAQAVRLGIKHGHGIDTTGLTAATATLSESPGIQQPSEKRSMKMTDEAAAKLRALIDGEHTDENDMMGKMKACLAENFPAHFGEKKEEDKGALNDTTSPAAAAKLSEAAGEKERKEDESEEKREMSALSAFVVKMTGKKTLPEQMAALTSIQMQSEEVVALSAQVAERSDAAFNAVLEEGRKAKKLTPADLAANSITKRGKYIATLRADKEHGVLALKAFLDPMGPAVNAVETPVPATAGGSGSGGVVVMLSAAEEESIKKNGVNRAEYLKNKVARINSGDAPKF